MADFSLSAKYQNNGNDIVLSWSKVVPGPYSVYTSDFVSGPWALIGTTNSSTFGLSNISPKTYFFQVKSTKFKPGTNQQYVSNIVAASPAKSSDASDASFFVPNKVSLDAPELSFTTDPANSSVVLNWNVVKNATHYSVYRSSAGGAPEAIADTANNTQADGTPYQTITDPTKPIYTYTVQPKAPTTFGPSSNAKSVFLSLDNGDDPVLGPPFPAVFYQLFINAGNPRLTWTVPDVLLNTNLNVIGPQIIGIYVTNFSSIPDGSTLYLHCGQQLSDAIARDVTDLPISSSVSSSFGLIADSNNNGTPNYDGNGVWEVNFVDMGYTQPTISFYINAIATSTTASVSGSDYTSSIALNMFGPTVLQHLTGTFSPLTITTGPHSGTLQERLLGNIQGTYSGSVNGTVNFNKISASIFGHLVATYINAQGTSSAIDSVVSSSFSGSVAGSLSNNGVIYGFISGSVTRTYVVGKLTGSFSGSAVGVATTDTGSNGSFRGIFGYNTLVDSQFITQTTS